MQTQTSQQLSEGIADVVDRYGEEAVLRLLELAPLLAPIAHRAAIHSALLSQLRDIDGVLVIRVPGLPGVPPTVAWCSGEAEPCWHNGRWCVRTPGQQADSK